VQRLGLALTPWSRLIVWPAINYLMAVVTWLIGRRLQGATVESQATGELGRYRLLAPIGAGGMGEVWKASHEMLARQAAIKLVRPRTTASSARQADLWVERFRREANVIAGLQSPNTIYLYDFGVSRDGQFYYAMELLDGVSLETLVKTFGPQPVGRVRSIVLQICTSLEEAHQRNLVHRDLKPSNVMLCKLALTYDFIKVLDFGLAEVRRLRGRDAAHDGRDGRGHARLHRAGSGARRGAHRRPRRRLRFGLHHLFPAHRDAGVFGSESR
jgi:serine/threonine-protein kinase